MHTIQAMTVSGDARAAEGETARTRTFPADRRVKLRRPASTRLPRPRKMADMPIKRDENVSALRLADLDHAEQAGRERLHAHRQYKQGERRNWKPRRRMPANRRR